MAHGNNTIPIPGELRSEATEGVAVSADAVKDYRKNKFQEQVNLDVDSEISNIKNNMYTKAEGTALEENVNAAIERQDSNILSKFESQDERINNKFSQQDAAMVSKFNQQDQLIDGRLDDQDEKIDTILRQKVEVVDTLPETGEEGIIYRVPSAEGDSYADYMWQDGEFKLIGTFEFPGIDDEPTSDSANVVRSGGIAAFYGVYEENPEWVYVMLDSQKHVLGGFKQDGSFEFGVGVPNPIREYVGKQLNTIITDYIDNKVDKEDGKGLIIVDFANGVSYDENPEWVFVQLDAEGKVLSGIKKDGTNFITRFEVGEFVDLDKLINKFANSYYNVSLNHTELESKVYYHPNSGWNQVEYDSSAYPYDETDTYNVGEICNVEGDTEHSYESTARQQGNYPAYTTVALHVTEKLNLAQALEKIPSDILSGFVAGQVITFVDNNDVVEKWELQNDETWEQLNPSVTNDIEERLSMELDRDDKILSYRKKDGTLVENAGIETNHLELTEQGMTDFQQALKDAGFTPGGGGDLSDHTYIQIPTKPVCAYINIIGIEQMPQWKGVNAHAWMEVYDGNGNYFKKRVILDAQGRSSLQQAKKNFAADFCEDEWEGDKTTTIKIGNWVSQDSFHFKAYYTDGFKVANILNYHLWEKFTSTYPITEDRPYKEYFADNYDATKGDIYDFEQNTKSEAKCVPDGFPAMVYLNGVFYGLFIWQLKKHRDNYFLDRNATDNIHLDGEHYEKLFSGDVNWYQEEIRNPKPKKSKWTLTCMDGSKYDGDNPKELIDSTSEVYDSSNTSHVKSAQTKANIIALSQYMSEISSLEVVQRPSDSQNISIGNFAGTWNNEDSFTKGTWVKDNGSYYISLHSENTGNSLSNAEYWLDITSNIATIKSEIEKRFGVKWMIDYAVLINLGKNGDSIMQNVQWVTYGKLDGKMKWYPCPYDDDMSFGILSTTSFVFFAPGYTEIGKDIFTPIKYIYKYYLDELKTRWSELRQKGIIDADNIISDIVKPWIDSIGFDNYEMEYGKWNESPCFRKAEINSKWERTGKEYLTYYDSISNWNTNNTYPKDAYIKYNRRCYQSLQANNIGHTPDEVNSEWWLDVTVKAGTYSEGDIVWDGYSNFYEFRAKENITVASDSGTSKREDNLINTPFNKFYGSYPREGGVYESIYRLYAWIKEQIQAIDSKLEYSN